MGLDPVLFEASSNHGLLVIESDSISGEAGPFAIAATCIDDSILDGPGADCFHEFDGIVGVPFPPDDVTSSLDAHHNPTLFAIPTDSAAPEIAVAERAFDSFRNSLSDASGSQIDTLAAADDGDASSVITGDFRIEDAVPALAVVALFVAGLLLLWLVRRHRRAAFVRRIKRNVSRNRQPYRSWSQQ